MKIIALSGSNSCGKTTSLNLVYKMIIDVGGISTNRKQEGGDKRDFSDIVSFNGLKVAFFTMGDSANHALNAIKNYNAQEADILIIANNIKFVKPIQAILKYENTIVPKNVANPVTEENNLTANISDANIIFGLFLILKNECNKIGADPI